MFFFIEALSIQLYFQFQKNLSFSPHLSLHVFLTFLRTSVCLIYYPASTPDSKKCWRDMKIPNIVSKTFTSPPIMLKIFRPEISVMVEISTDFDLLGVIEFQIYGSILPVFQANLGKILEKILSSCIH